MSSLRGVIRWAEGLAGALRLGIGVLLIFMMLLNGANAFGRFVLGRSIVGADEVLIFSMIWLVFLGAAVATWKRRHLSIDLLRPRLARAAQRWFLVLYGLTLALVCLFVAAQSHGVILQLGRIDQRSMAAQIPMTIPHAAVIVGLGLAALFALVQVIALSATTSEYDEYDQPDEPKERSGS